MGVEFPIKFTTTGGDQLRTSAQDMEKLGAAAGKTATELEKERAAQDQASEAAGRFHQSGGLLSDILHGIEEGASSSAGQMVLLGGAIGVGEAIAEKFLEVAAEIPKVLIEWTMEATTAARQLTNLHTATDISIQGLQEMKTAVNAAGGDMSIVARGVTLLEGKIEKGSESFAKLGLSMEELRGMDPGEAFERVTQALEDVDNQFEKVAIARDLFGKAGAGAMLPFIEEMKTAAQTSEELNVVLSDDNVQAMTQLRVAVTEAGDAWDGMKDHLVAAVAENPEVINGVQSIVVAISLMSRVVESTAGPVLDFFTKLAAYSSPAAIGIGMIADGLKGLEKYREESNFENYTTKASAAQLAALQNHHQETFAIDDIESFNSKGSPSGAAANAASEAAAKADVAAAEKAAREKEQIWHQESVALAQDLAERNRQAQASYKQQTDMALQEMEVRLAADKAADAEQISAQRDARKGIESEAKAIGAALRRMHEESVRHILDIANTFGDLSGVVGDAAGLFTALGMSADSGLAKIMGGLQGVLGAAQNFTAALATGNVAGMIGAGLQGLTSIVGTIKSLFSKPEYKKVMSDVGKEWGVDISEGLAKSIEETEKSLGVSRGVAESLHLNDIVAESGKAMHDFSDQIFQLMSGIQNGSVPAAEGLDQVGQAFSSVVDEAAKAGTVGDALTVAMLKTAQAAGTMTDSMKEFVSAQNQAMAAGAGKIGEGLSHMDLKGMGKFGEDAALFFASGFEQAIQEKGLMGALDQLGPQAEKMFQQMTKAGDTAGAALLKPFASLQKQIGDSDQLKGMLTTLEGMGDVFKGAANQGMLDPQMQAAFGETIKQAHDSLISAGVDGKAAMQAVMPELKAAIDAAQQMGVPLDAKTAEMKAAAEGLGFSFPVDPMIQMVDLMKTLVQGMGFELPASAQNAAAAIGGIGTAAQQAAGATSSATSTMVGALDGAAAQSGTFAGTVITNFGQIGPGVVAALSGASDGVSTAVDGMVATADAKTQQLQGMFQAIGNTSIVIPFSYQQQGEGPQNMPPGGGGPPPGNNDHHGKPGSYSTGLDAGPVTSTGWAILHGTPSSPEHVFTHSQFMTVAAAMSRGSRGIPGGGGGGRGAGDLHIHPGAIVVQAARDPKATAQEVVSELQQMNSSLRREIQRTIS